jgi:hypothetical protein
MDGEKHRQARKPEIEIAMFLLWIVSLVSLLLWGILIFAAHVATGWVHLLLALACILAARAIIGRTGHGGDAHSSG